ncbi:hypothetical protein BCR32DRAFT_267958 [Anaeromyces robustus]|uniref:Uncharacterized protein n=1 Tax=Anaeromyces robustus TaxID=1754192 RepID=A0A1Y1X9A5_9FUNG|nr:hypothetical protein BCR32DRAFT_267958 [Anaeromyces robustus]|eukprot:ORX81986.1 hypothetical protein BCR32DRAFT_267958 [Anaeromyces robustus]
MEKKKNSTKKKNKTKTDNGNTIKASLKYIDSEERKKRIENVIKQKKLDGLKKKLNEYTKEKLLEKYREIKNKEKLELLNEKRNILENLKRENLINKRRNILSIKEDDSNKNSVPDKNTDTNTNDDADVNKNDNINESDSLIYLESESEASLITETISKDSCFDIKSTESISEISSLSSIPVEFSKHKKEPSMIKKLFHQKHSSEENKSPIANNIKISNKNNINEYIKADDKIAQVYGLFCKKSNIPINDSYSQFILDNLTKSQINDFLNIKPLSSRRTSTFNTNRSYYNNSNNSVSSRINSNEVTINSGTNGFRNREIYIQHIRKKKEKFPPEKIKKIKALQDIRVRYINSLLSFNDCIQSIKKLQKEKKELLWKKKAVEVTMNKKIGVLINKIDALTNDIDQYNLTKSQKRNKLETEYNTFVKKVKTKMIELDIVYYKKKREYDNILKELQQLKQFEEKFNTHPELLLKEIEILHDKMKEDDENYKSELKRMELREKIKEKEMEELKQQNINYIIFSSYSNLSTKIIDAYMKRVEQNKKLKYEHHVQKECQENLIKQIDHLIKENNEIQKDNNKKIFNYKNIISNIKPNINNKCPTNEIYKFELQIKDKKLNQRQIVLNKIQDLKSKNKKNENTNKDISLNNITTGISPSNVKLYENS